MIARFPTPQRLLRLLAAGLLASVFGAPVLGADEVVLGVHRVTLEAPTPGGATITRVDFDQAYAETPAVFVLPDEANADPSTVRILDVDSTGFDVVIVEPRQEDFVVTSTTIDYFAVVPFDRDFQGTRMEAAIIENFAFDEGRNVATTSPDRISFAQNRIQTPIVLAQLQSSNNQPALGPGSAADPWMTMLVDDVDDQGFDLAIERSEDDQPRTLPETVAWFAIDADTTFELRDTAGDDLDARSTLSADDIVGHDNGCRNAPFGFTFPTPPKVFGNKQTRDGGDGGWLRRCATSSSGATLVVDEDRIGDGERSHTDERAGLLAFERAFTAASGGQTPFTGEVGSAFIPPSSGDTAAFTRVTFPNAFGAGVTPLVFTLPTEVDPAPAALRVRNVDSAGFDVAAIEPPGEVGAHDAMTIDYVAVAPGTHRLDDGRLIEAGFEDTQRFQSLGLGGTSWEPISFSQTFDVPPGPSPDPPVAFITQIQTTANEPLIDPSGTSQPFLTSVSRAVSATGGEVALERSEVTVGALTTTERIGWLAAETGAHGTLLANDGATVEYDFASGTTVLGFDNGCFTAPFTAAFPSSALVVADKNSRNGNNGGWLRRCAAPTSANVGLHVDEDRFADAERDHIAETTSIFAFERGFDWAPSEPDILLLKASTVSNDPVNAGSNPKRIPGALIDYTITASNLDKAATDADSVVVTDTLPGSVELFLGDLAAGAPIQFIDGAEPSGLTFQFIAVDSPADDLEFTQDASANPVDWSYQPSPGLDYDPTVDAFRVAPTGALAGQTGPTAPSFSIRYRTRLD